MNKIILLAISILSLHVNAQRQKVEFNQDIVKYPELNKEEVCIIGNSLVLNKNIIKKEALKIINIPDFKVGMRQHDMFNGVVLPVQQSEGDEYYYYNETGKEYIFGLIINKENNFIRAFVTNNTDTFFGLNNVRKKADKYNIEYEYTEVYSNDCNTCYSYEFIYNGKNGNNVKFIYKEYIRDLARSSFFQEVEYDISDNKIIKYKNMEIEILEAKPSEVKYKVLRHLD